MSNVIDFEAKKRSLKARPKNVKDTKHKMNKIRRDIILNDASSLVTKVMLFVEMLEKELK